SRRLHLEALEDRSLPSAVSISVGDASVIEGDAAVRPLGAFVSSGVGGLVAPYAMTIGPDGNLYVSSQGPGGNNSVYRYDATTGSPLPAPGKTGAEFVSPGSGGLSSARDIAFGPDGSLDVVSEETSAVLRFDATTGAYQGTLVVSGA